MAYFEKHEAGSDLEGNSGKITAIYLCVFLASAVVLAMIEQLGAPAAAIGLVLAGLTLAAYALIGLLARTGHAHEFFRAGRSVAPAAGGMALAAQWTGLAGFAALQGTLYGLGFDGLAFIIGPLAGLVLLGVLIAPFLNKLGVTTVAELFGVRYGALPRLIAVGVTVAALAPLLVAQLQGFGIVAREALGQPAEWAVAAAAAVVVASALPGGLKGVTWTQVAQYLVLAAAVLVPAAYLSFQLTGLPLPHLALGAAVERIAVLEPELVEKGLASASTLKPHLAPFLVIDARNFLAIVVCLAAGVAALPHFLMRSFAAPSVRHARLSAAWGAFFALAVAATLPATAALAKLQVYTLINSGTAFSSLPAWMEGESRRDRIRIHGVSLAMLEKGQEAVRAGADDAAAVQAYIATRAAGTAEGYAALRDTVKAALAEAAKSDGDTWDTFRKTVLPAAAKAAGNKTGQLTEPGLWIAPTSLVLAVPDMVDMPTILAALTIAGLLAATLAAASGTAHALASTIGQDLVPGLLGRGAPESRRIAAVRLVMMAAVGAASYAALRLPVDVPALAQWSFSLAAAGLFPALVLGIWWKRANAWGATLGMLAGFSLCLAYLAGSQFFPVELHGLTGQYSTASDIALRRMESLEAVWSGAEGDAKLAARAALEAYARGSHTAPGVANLFGILPVASGAIGMLVGFLVIFIVSLITPRPWAETTLIVDGMRRPGGAPILDDG